MKSSDIISPGMTPAANRAPIDTLTNDPYNTNCELGGIINASVPATQMVPGSAPRCTFAGATPERQCSLRLLRTPCSIRRLPRRSCTEQCSPERASRASGPPAERYIQTPWRRDRCAGSPLQQSRRQAQPSIRKGSKTTRVPLPEAKALLPR